MTRRYTTVKGLLNGLLKFWSEPKHWVKGYYGIDLTRYNMEKAEGRDNYDAQSLAMLEFDTAAQLWEDPKDCAFCFVGGVRALSASEDVQRAAMCLIANQGFKGAAKVSTIEDAQSRMIDWNDAEKRTLGQLRQKLRSVIRKVEKDPSLGKL